MYAAYGVASPFLPAFVHERGLPATQLGLALGASTAIRLLSAPIAGRIADLLQALRAVLVVCTALAALVTLGYLPAHSFWMLVVLLLAQAAALAPMTILSDALALGAASRPPGFEYGWVRGTGSAAFIIGLLASGQLIEVLGLYVIIGLQSALLACAALAATRVPEVVHTCSADVVREPAKGVLILLKIAPYRTLILFAALVLGSHAMNDAFAVIRWSAAGINAGTSSVLWSEAVASEVVVFFLIGPALIARLTPAGALALSAVAGVLRWTVMAQASDVIALALVQPLHGITFALLHLSCMRLIAQFVPHGLEGTAQAVYGTVGVGGATALLTMASGALYARIGAHGFWVMAALCLVALPLTLKLRLRVS